jgi:hypothetical protein
MSAGFIKLSRKFFTNHLWNEARVYSKCEAWLDLIQMARIEQSKVIVNNKVIELQRGETCASVRYLAKRWSWGEQKVRTYMKNLVDFSMVTQRQHSGETVVSLVKYSAYNGSQHTDEAENNTATTQRQHSDNTATTQSIRSKEDKNVRTKEEIKIQRPSLDEFLEYVEIQLKEDFPKKKFAAEKKYNAWVENGWKDGNDKVIKNWKSKILHTIPYLVSQTNQGGSEKLGGYKSDDVQKFMEIKLS